MFNTSAWTHTPKPNTLLHLHLLLLQKHQNKKNSRVIVYANQSTATLVFFYSIRLYYTC